MFSLKQQPIAEHEATGEIERVYHEIRQTLRLSGINLLFRTWAMHGDFLPLVWDALRPTAETAAFESAADQLRAGAAQAAETLGPLGVQTSALGPSQLFQVRCALDLYHYANPKLLVLASTVNLALQGEKLAADSQPMVTRLLAGTPPQMYPMEMEDEEPSDTSVQAVFDDIKKSLSLERINSDYRTLALWPEYLVAAWRKLKPIVGQAEFQVQGEQLLQQSRILARQLPYPFPLDVERLKEANVALEEVRQTTQSFEHLLPSLLLNIALLQRDWREGAELAASPFPPSAQTAAFQSAAGSV